MKIDGVNFEFYFLENFVLDNTVILNFTKIGAVKTNFHLRPKMNSYSYFPNLRASGSAVVWRTAHVGSIPDTAVVASIGWPLYSLRE